MQCGQKLLTVNTRDLCISLYFLWILRGQWPVLTSGLRLENRNTLKPSRAGPSSRNNFTYKVNYSNAPNTCAGYTAIEMHAHIGKTRRQTTARCTPARLGGGGGGTTLS